MTNILIIGQGDIGLAVTNTLAKKAVATNEAESTPSTMKVTGLARGERQDYELEATAAYIQADALELTLERLQPFTHIAIIVTPDSYNADNYKQTYLGIAQHFATFASQLTNLQRLVFISSTGVYGQDAGEWIDEHTQPVIPKRAGSQYILQAEQALQQAYGVHDREDCDISDQKVGSHSRDSQGIDSQGIDRRSVIIRPSGIYGSHRRMRINKAQETDKAPMPQYAWTNRIMDSDLVTIIVNVLLASQDDIKPMYLATDYQPVTAYELTYWLSEQLNAPMPLVDSTLCSSGKRLHSNIPLTWLAFPDWQAGYHDILSTSHSA